MGSDIHISQALQKVDVSTVRQVATCTTCTWDSGEKHQNIIQMYENIFVQRVSQNIIYSGLEHSWSICQTKSHG